MESFCFVLIFTRLTAKEKKLHTICLDNEIFIKIPKRSNIFEVNISHFYTALVIIFCIEIFTLCHNIYMEYTLINFNGKGTMDFIIFYCLSSYRHQFRWQRWNCNARKPNLSNKIWSHESKKHPSLFGHDFEPGKGRQIFEGIFSIFLILILILKLTTPDLKTKTTPR